MATAQSHGNQISMENWSSPFWSPSLLGISMWFSSFCSFFPKSDVTPGGTKIVYERAFLVNMRNSPLSRTPPTNLPSIPGVTSDLGKKEQKLENHIEMPNKEGDQNGDEQFSMDI